MSEEKTPKSPEYTCVFVFPREVRFRSLLSTWELDKLAKIANDCYFYCSEDVVLEIERNGKLIHRVHKRRQSEPLSQLEPGELQMLNILSAR